jgi:TRAP-type C4-dicarboxylate transport system permease small subunit
VTEAPGGRPAPQDGSDPRRRWLWRALDSAEEVICYALLIALVVVTSLQVFTRYVLNAPFTWTEELARMLFTWIVFLGAALLLKRSSHISIDILARSLAPEPRRWLLVLSHLITLSVVGILAVKGFRLLQITGASESPALGIPWVYVYAAFPVGMSLMALRYARALIGLVRAPGVLGGAAGGRLATPEPPA